MNVFFAAGYLNATVLLSINSWWALFR